MIRYAMGAGFALVLCAVTVLAKDYTGTVKSVDPDKNTITITIKDGDKDKDVTLKVDKDAKITRKNKQGEDTDVKDGLKNEKAWGKNKQGDFPTVTVTTEGEGDKEIAKTIKFVAKKKADKDK